ncbi:MAG: M1 family aminopeptidase [Phycisphaerales bacterium]
MFRRSRSLPAALLACAGSLGAPALAHSPDADCPGDEACGKVATLRLLHRLGRAPSGAPNPFTDRSQPDQTDVLQNDLSIEVFPTTQTIAGTCTITLKSLVDNLTDFTISLAPALTPGTILVNNIAVPPPTTTGTLLRTIALDRPYNTGETIVLSIPYAGAITNGQSGVLWAAQDGQPVISSFSEPFDAGTWWPCKDGDYGLSGDNTDKAVWRLAITHDSVLTAVSNGQFLGTDPAGPGKVTSRWSSDYPMATYLSFFSLAKYNAWTLVYNGAPVGNAGPITIPLRFFVFSASDTPARRAAWERVVPMLDALRPLFGEYPFPAEGYGIYQFPFSGGMEHQTLVGQGNFAEQVTIHELGHQWWGNNVTCRTWSDLWLNEGFASYTEALWAEFKPGSVGSVALQNYMIGSKPAFENVGGTVYCLDTSSEARLFSRDLTYKKAQWVLHMLRGIVGDTAFFEILATWRATYQGSAATTDQFRDICEQVSGQDLQWFFDQWVFGPGAPSYAKGLQTFVLNGKYWTRFHVRQTQDTAWPVFTNPLLVRFSTATGPVDHIVKPIARTSYFVRASGTAGASDLFFDPNNWVLNYGIAGEAPLQGPPVVLSSLPAAGSSTDFAAPLAQLKFEFSENTSAGPATFVVRRSDGSVVDFSYSYSSPAQTATLSFPTRLSPNTYTVELASVPASIGSGQALDGDVVSPDAPASYPTGDGVAGTSQIGIPMLRFSVVPGSCPCDLNSDTMVDDADFVIFAYDYDQLVTMNSDFNGDGVTDDADFVLFAAAYDQLLCP